MTLPLMACGGGGSGAAAPQPVACSDSVPWQSSDYVLAEIADDVLIDSHPDPLEYYWQDDTFEILIDEDASGGLHHFDYNAFAYHIALDSQVVDIGPYLSDKDREIEIANIRTYREHVQAIWAISTQAFLGN